MNASTISIVDADPDLAEQLDDEALERAFERFYRADAARTRDPDRSRGSGLGLAIARAIAEAHGGKLEASNHPEGGAVFSLFLPAV